jgi:hypothetical protein
MRFSNELAALASMLALAAVGCGSDGGGTKTEPTCLPAPGPRDCTALYQPTFANVFSQTLQMHCATTRCHVQPTPTGGMALDSLDTAYDNLVNKKSANGEPRVKPGDTQCGKVIVRLSSVDEPWSMPPGPGSHLMPSELCSIRQWIANGAMK